MRFWDHLQQVAYCFYAVMPCLIVVFLPLALCKMLALQRLTVCLILLLFFLTPFLIKKPAFIVLSLYALCD